MTSRPATGPHLRASAQNPPQGSNTPPVGGLFPAVTAAPEVPPLIGDVPDERHRLSPLVTRYWRWRMAASALPVLVLLIALAIVLPWGEPWMRWTVVGVVTIAAAISLVLVPPIRYRVFWYAISPTEIDVQHGVIFVKRSVVPMHRVQSLRTERGPMADHYRMTNLRIRTAAGSVTLSGLGRAEADELCDRISQLADVADYV